MRKTEVFGIDIPELGDPSDITVVSDAIHDVENAMGCRIEFMNAVNTPGLISLNSKVRIHPYTTYYDDMVFAFIAPIDIPVGNSIAIKIDDLPQQPFNNEAFNGKGSLVFITYNTKSGFKSYENGSKIINNLTTGGANDALSAEMGKQLQNSKLDKTDAWRIQPKELPSGTDLNNVIEPGFYMSIDNKNIIHNIPTGIFTSFELTVTVPDNSKKYTTQLLKTYNANNYYARYQIGGEWNKWQKIALEDEVVKKSGDTMTGTLDIKTSGHNIQLHTDKNRVAIITVDDNALVVSNTTSQKGIRILNSGSTYIDADNLQTPQKEVIEATNGLYDILQKNSGLNFDENLLFLNDIGTKTQGKIYFDRLTQGMFECIQTTTSTVNNMQYFKNISNKENSNRLSNLFNTCEVLADNMLIKGGGSTVKLAKSVKLGDVIHISFGVDISNKNYHQIVIVPNNGAPDGNKDSVNVIGYVGNNFNQAFLFDIMFNNDTIEIKDHRNTAIGITRVMRFR